MGSRLGLSILLSAVLVVGACGTDSTAPGAESRAKREAPPDLSARFVTDSEVPDGFVRDADIPGETGPFDIDAAVDESEDPVADRAALEDSGFVAGHVRFWAQEGSDAVSFSTSELGVTLWFHSSAAGAASYLKYFVQSTGGSNTSAADCGVEEIPTATCQLNFDGSGNGGGMVAFARGRYVAAVMMHGPRASVVTLREVAERQHSRLSA